MTLKKTFQKWINPHPASAATLSHPMGEGLGVTVAHGKEGGIEIV
jgi:hypothetical protein